LYVHGKKHSRVESPGDLAKPLTTLLYQTAKG